MASEQLETLCSKQAFQYGKEKIIVNLQLIAPNSKKKPIQYFWLFSQIYLCGLLLVTQA